MLGRANLPARHRERTGDRSGPWLDSFGDCTRLLGTGALIALIGNRGTGKTQLGCDLIRWVCEREAEKPNPPSMRIDGQTPKPPEGGWRRREVALYSKALSLFIDLRSCYRDGGPGEESVVSGFCKIPLLVIDEIHERGNTDWEDRMLVHIVDRRYDTMLDTVLIGNVAPDQLQKQLGASIVSRIQECGRVVVCDWPSFRAPPG